VGEWLVLRAERLGRPQWNALLLLIDLLDQNLVGASSPQADLKPAMIVLQPLAINNNLLRRHSYFYYC
jgi:hypothetical protein